MNKLNSHPDVIRIAHGLELDPANPVAAILKYCSRRVRRWVKETPVDSIGAMEELVCRKLNLVIEEVNSDEELDRVVSKYLAKGEIVFATLKDDLAKPSNFATLIERTTGVTANSHDRYVAIVDCRGEKGHRRFFTKWHEIAHVLTLYRQLELPLHRSYRLDSLEAEERLMDLIASRVGFYRPLFEPVAKRNIADCGRLTFDAVTQTIEEFSSEVSFDAAANAMLKYTDDPALKLKVGLRYKRAEEKIVKSIDDFLIPPAMPKPKLRVAEVVANDSANSQGFRIHKNMRVPKKSIIYSAHHDPFQTGKSEENLNFWSSSDGRAPKWRPVHVETQYIGERLCAFVIGKSGS